MLEIQEAGDRRRKKEDRDMAKMTQSEYNSYKALVESIARNGSKEQLQRLYDEIYLKYDDGSWCCRMLDGYQSRWSVDTHQ